MSEVKRYRATIGNGSTRRREWVFLCSDVKPSGEHLFKNVSASAVDELVCVTAERDAALGRAAVLESSFDELAASVGFSEARLDQTGDSPIDCANQLQQLLTAAEDRVGELLIMLRMAWVDTEVSGENCRRIEAALKPAEIDPYQGIPGTSFQRLNALANQGE